MGRGQGLRAWRTCCTTGKGKKLTIHAQTWWWQGLATQCALGGEGALQPSVHTAPYHREGARPRPPTHRGAAGEGRASPPRRARHHTAGEGVVSPPSMEMWHGTAGEVGGLLLPAVHSAAMEGQGLTTWPAQHSEGVEALVPTFPAHTCVCVCLAVRGVDLSGGGG